MVDAHQEGETTVANIIGNLPSNWNYSNSALSLLEVDQINLRLPAMTNNKQPSGFIYWDIGFPNNTFVNPWSAYIEFTVENKIPASDTLSMLKIDGGSPSLIDNFICSINKDVPLINLVDADIYANMMLTLEMEPHAMISYAHLGLGCESTLSVNYNDATGALPSAYTIANLIGKPVISDAATGAAYAQTESKYHPNYTNGRFSAGNYSFLGNSASSVFTHEMMFGNFQTTALCPFMLNGLVSTATNKNYMVLCYPLYCCPLFSKYLNLEGKHVCSNIIKRYTLNIRISPYAFVNCNEYLAAGMGPSTYSRQFEIIAAYFVADCIKPASSTIPNQIENIARGSSIKIRTNRCDRSYMSYPAGFQNPTLLINTNRESLRYVIARMYSNQYQSLGNLRRQSAISGSVTNCRYELEGMNYPSFSYLCGNSGQNFPSSSALANQSNATYINNMLKLTGNDYNFKEKCVNAVNATINSACTHSQKNNLVWIWNFDWISGGDMDLTGRKIKSTPNQLVFQLNDAPHDAIDSSLFHSYSIIAFSVYDIVIKISDIGTEISEMALLQ